MYGRKGRPGRQAVWRAVLLFLISVVVAGCGGPEDAASGGPEDRDSGGIEATATASGPGALPEATAGVSSTIEASEAAQGGAVASRASSGPPFHADPAESGGSGLEADGLLAVRYGAHEGYERVVLDLGTGRDPAKAVPEWTLTSPTGDGLLRVELPSVSATAVSDGEFGGTLLKDFHVVRGPEGGMFVDVFARESFTYRVLELTDPARLVVDFKAADMPLGIPLPAQGGKTVLTEPRRGDHVDGSLTVSGYSRNFEAVNTITLTDAAGDRIAGQTVQGNDWNATWGYFETTLDVPAFSGRAILRVGTGSARDGSFEGVEIPVRGS